MGQGVERRVTRASAAPLRVAREPKLRRLDVAEMVNTLPPELPWLAEPMLLRGALTLLVGREGQGKSLLAMALAIGVAAGEPVAGFRPAAGRVLLVDAENGPAEIHRRVRALGLPNGAAGNLAVYCTEGLDLRRDLEELEDVIGQESPSLVVLDSFRSLWSGSENDSEEVAPVLDRLRNLGRREDAGLLLLHHTGKAGAEYRGSTAIGAAAEAIFTLGREPEDDDPQRRYLACQKLRSAPEPGRRWLRLSTELGLTFVDEWTPPEGAEETRGRPAREAPRLAPQVLALVRERGPIHQADVARTLGRQPSDGTVRRVLEALENREDKPIRRRADKAWEACQKSGTPRGYGNSGNGNAPAVGAT